MDGPYPPTGRQSCMYTQWQMTIKKNSVRLFRLCRGARPAPPGTRSFGSSSSSSSAFELPPPIGASNRVVVTGIGLVTPLGVGKERVWNRLVKGDTAIRGLKATDLPKGHETAFPHLASKVIGCVPKEEIEDASIVQSVAGDARYASPFIKYALIATAEALSDAKWHPTETNEKAHTGVAVGAGMSSTFEMTEAGMLLKEGRLRRLSPFFVPRTLINMPAGLISIIYGFQGPNHAASTACATGAHSIGDAYQIVKRGDAKVMVAGGTDSCIDAVALSGFSKIKALSTKFNDYPELASRPFDKERDGFVMGEGAGILILEELEHARKRGAHIYVEIRGYGLSGDAYHITQPSPNGCGAQLAMRRAIAASGVSPSQIAYVNAHATSTPLGDEVEQRAIAAVFGTHLRNIIVSSCKGAVGHLLGAAGAVEAAFSVLALCNKTAPPNRNLENPDPCLVPLAGKSSVELPHQPFAVMSNSFGFGGTNAALIFGPPPV